MSELKKSRVKVNSILVSGRKDYTLTYTKYVRDEKTGASIEETLDKQNQIIGEATGLSQELIETIEGIDTSLAKLNDTVYPITLSLSVNPNVSTMQTNVRYSVSNDGEPFIPDTLLFSKQVNDDAVKIIANAPTASGVANTAIEGGREIFTFAVTKEGRTGKSTSQTKYLCYYGGNSSANATSELLSSLSKVSTSNVSFNPKVTTKDSDYIWLAVPSYLTISKVTSAGFDVPLSSPQTVTNSLGSFKAYRTANALTANTWNLVIS